MATRTLVYYGELELFREWLINNGFSIENTKSKYEVLRARNKKHKQPLIVFMRERGCGYTIQSFWEGKIWNKWYDFKTKYQLEKYGNPYYLELYNTEEYDKLYNKKIGNYNG